MEEIGKAIVDFIPNIVAALMVAGLGIFLAFIIVRITRKAMTKAKVDPSLLNFTTKATRIVIYIFTALATLSMLNISIAGLVAFFSAAAAAIALALKDRLSDIASGVVILFTKPFVTGDFIDFSGHQGYVKKIDIMHTTIETYDKIDVIVPNSVITSSEVSNFTAKPDVRVTVEVPIPYEADIEKVKTALTKALEATENTINDENHVAKVRLEKFGESAMEFSVRCFCDYKDYWTVFYALTENVKHKLDESGVTIPFNQLDVHIKNE